MNRKISVRIDEETVRLAMRRAVEERRPLSELLRDALVQYLRKSAATPEERKIAFRLFCERPMKIPSSQLRYVLDEDVLDQ